MSMPDDLSPGVSAQLKTLTDSGSLQADAAQFAVAGHLDRILDEMRARVPAQKRSALGWLFSKNKKAEAAKGLYVYGSVGRGKTMLMDMFFKMAPVESKRRAHFHEFMADVHARIHAQRQRFKAGETKQADPVPPVAASIRAEAELLCFDEFTVTDIADAMILSRLFTELFAHGCILVATSNVEPDNLYFNGLNRGLFLPFIGLLKQYVTVTTLDSPTDYRMEKLDSLPVYVTPLGTKADAAMDAAWSRVTGGEDSEPTHIPMKGRQIDVPLACGRAARFSFASLCEVPLGASDYLAIAHRFDTVFVENIPCLSPAKRNETKRFIILIDTLYDNSVRLFASGEKMPEELLVERKGTEGFEFDRTISRLFEMRSADYLALHREKRGL